MNDPHVEELIYRVETGEELRIIDPSPVEEETAEFRMRLADGIATFKMKPHYSSEENAREPVEAYVRAWELHVALVYGYKRKLHFIFERPKIIDRNPPPPSPPGTPVNLKGELSATVTTEGHLTVIPQLRHYPEPPRDFVASPDVATMWQRYEGYLQGREALQSMANFCWTVLELSAKGFPAKQTRDKVASMYHVCPKVLRMLGYLTSNVGDLRTGRKATVANRRSLTPQEVKWLEEVVKKLIRRAGEYAADPQKQWRQITLADPDLPQL
jgi:hypothetical protein